MKTNQILTRKMGNYDVVQRTEDGYFDGNALLRQWNKDINHTRRDMDEFLGQKSTKEFISTIIGREKPKSENAEFGNYQVVIKGKKRALKEGGSLPASIWMHPILFIDFAMWINPSFKYDVLKFVQDELIRYRNDAGDAYREMATHVAKLVEKPLMQAAMKDVAKALNYIVYNNHEPMMRNKQAHETSLREMVELERDIVKLIHFGFIKTYNALRDYLRERWRERWQPKVLTA